MVPFKVTSVTIPAVYFSLAGWNWNSWGWYHLVEMLHLSLSVLHLVGITRMHPPHLPTKTLQQAIFLSVEKGSSISEGVLVIIVNASKTFHVVRWLACRWQTRDCSCKILKRNVLSVLLHNKSTHWKVVKESFRCSTDINLFPMWSKCLCTENKRNTA